MKFIVPVGMEGDNPPHRLLVWLLLVSLGVSNVEKENIFGIPPKVGEEGGGVRREMQYSTVQGIVVFRR